jgi:hypothetical protein
MRFRITASDVAPIAGIEETLMPNASIIIRGTLPGGAVNMSSLLADSTVKPQQVSGYAVWQKPLTAFNSQSTYSRAIAEPYPTTVNLNFALSESGTFYVGAEGTVPDVLSVIGTLNCVLYYGVWEFVTPSEWGQDDGIFEPRDIGLAGMWWREALDLQSRGLVGGVSANLYDFRTNNSISVKHKLTKSVFVIYYPIFIVRGSEIGDYGVNLPMNARWSQFASIYDNGTATRSVKINYQGVMATYIYPVLFNNNSESSWIRLDGEEILRQQNWGLQSKKIYNRYPVLVELGANKTWSHVNPAITLTIVADKVWTSDQTENPSLGQRRNPPPDLLELTPNQWYPQ